MSLTLTLTISLTLTLTLALTIPLDPHPCDVSRNGEPLLPKSTDEIIYQGEEGVMMHWIEPPHIEYKGSNHFNSP
jgi:hypothetical protein